MTDWLNRCQFGDCRALMPAWPASIADTCITDPPYGDTDLDWDKQVAGWLPAVAHVLKPAASIWVFGSLRFLAPLFAEMEREGFRYSQDIVWEKQNGTGLHVDRFRRVHEHAVMFYRGNWADVYHDAQKTDDATKRIVRRREKPAHWSSIGAGSYTSEAGGTRLMRSVLAVANEHRRAVHPTQKPLAILAPLIRYSAPPGGLVVDPFAGSLSTGIAARQLGRNFAACERDARVMGMQEERMRQASLEIDA